jgi:hypothetical protein
MHNGAPSGPQISASNEEIPGGWIWGRLLIYAIICGCHRDLGVCD